MNDTAVQARKNRIMLVALVLVFFLPVLSAWYLVFFTDYFRGVDSAEHGNLIEPPRLLPDVPLTDRHGEAGQDLHGEWTLIALADSACESACRENLYRMRQIRLATGKDMQRVQRVLLHNNVDDMNGITSTYPGQLFLSMQDTGQEFRSAFFQQHAITDQGMFLVDPRGYLMMYYPYDTDPSGIIRDLKRLLRLSGRD